MDLLPTTFSDDDARAIADRLRDLLGPDPTIADLLREIAMGDAQQPVRLVTYPELRTRKGISWTRQYVDRIERDGKFPQRIQTGANSIAWLEAEIDAWIRARPRGRIRDRRNGPLQPESPAAPARRTAQARAPGRRRRE